MMELKPSYITAIFDTISDKYGSLDNYLEKQLNVSNKDILLLRDKFLEQTN
jgi:protein tyrosine/serine phosphatase